MAGPNKKPRQQELFLGALLTSPTIALAAKAAHISEATAARWIKEPTFQKRYAEAKQQAFGEALNYLQQTMLGAVAVLRSVMLSDTAKAATRVTAASKLLELAFRSHELYELEQRIAALEATLGGKR